MLQFLLLLQCERCGEELNVWFDSSDYIRSSLLQSTTKEFTLSWYNTMVYIIYTKITVFEGDNLRPEMCIILHLHLNQELVVSKRL